MIYDTVRNTIHESLVDKGTLFIFNRLELEKTRGFMNNDSTDNK